MNSDQFQAFLYKMVKIM